VTIASLFKILGGFLKMLACRFEHSHLSV
jgi:hypothetical protein